MTSKSLTDDYAGRLIDNDNCEVILSTDLSVAYDNIDHEIVLDQLLYFFIEGNENKQFQSYYSNKVLKFHKIQPNKTIMQQIFQCQLLDVKHIEHNVIQFIKGSNSVIRFKHKDQMDKYLHMYFWLLKIK